MYFGQIILDLRTAPVVCSAACFLAFSRRLEPIVAQGDWMSRVENSPESKPDKKRFFDSCAWMWMKLRWEIDQMKVEVSKPPTDNHHMAAVYHAHNCVITAWSLTDWVFEEFQSQLMADNARGFAGCDSLRKLQTLVKSECPYLKVCEQLAIGAKHRHLKFTESDPSLEAGYTSLVDRMKVGDTVGRRLVRRRNVPSIEIEGTDHDADIIFDAVAEYWFEKLKVLKEGVVEDGIV